MSLIVSTTIDSNVIALANLILASMVTTPGGIIPSKPDQTTGGITAEEVDCTQLQLVMSAPDAAHPGFTQITISFPGSLFTVTGWISSATLRSLMRPLNWKQNASGAIGPTASLVTFTSPAISAMGSGVIAVDGSVSGTLSVQEIVTTKLYRDYGLLGQVLLVQNNVSPGGTIPVGFNAPLTWDDLLPDTLPHTYTIEVSVPGGSVITIPAGGGDFQLNEL